MLANIRTGFNIPNKTLFFLDFPPHFFCIPVANRNKQINRKNIYSLYTHPLSAVELKFIFHWKLVLSVNTFIFAISFPIECFSNGNI